MNESVGPDDGALANGDEMDFGLLNRGDGKISNVGLGGSAGAITAVQAFLAAMRADSGLAFVVMSKGWTAIRIASHSDHRSSSRVQTAKSAAALAGQAIVIVNVRRRCSTSMRESRA